jgi:hypothetical protein
MSGKNAVMGRVRLPGRPRRPFGTRRKRSPVSVRRAVVYELLITGLLLALVLWGLDVNYAVVMWGGTLVGFVGAVHDGRRADRRRDAGTGAT